MQDRLDVAGVAGDPGDRDGQVEDLLESALLDRYCAENGRDPASIVRSIHLPVSYDEPAVTRTAIAAAIDAGFGHIVLGLPSLYPAGLARWVAHEIINATTD